MVVRDWARSGEVGENYGDGSKREWRKAREGVAIVEELSLLYHDSIAVTSLRKRCRFEVLIFRSREEIS